MKGKIVLFSLSLICAFSFVACGQNTQSEISNEDSCMQNSETWTGGVDETEDCGQTEMFIGRNLVSENQILAKVDKLISISSSDLFVPIELFYGMGCFHSNYFDLNTNKYSGILYVSFSVDDGKNDAFILKELAWEEVKTGKYEVNWTNGGKDPVLFTETIMLPIEIFANGKGCVSIKLASYETKRHDNSTSMRDLGYVEMYYERIENEIQFYKIVYFQ